MKARTRWWIGSKSVGADHRIGARSSSTKTAATACRNDVLPPAEDPSSFFDFAKCAGGCYIGKDSVALRRADNSMRKFMLGVVMGALAGWGFALAATGFDHNGSFWNKLDSSAKNGYVDGYSDAMQVSQGKLDNLTVAADLFHWKGAKKIIHQVSRELTLSDLNSGEVVKHLNELYSNRKYSELDLGSALQLLTMRAGDHSDAAAVPNPPAPTN